MEINCNVEHEKDIALVKQQSESNKQRLDNHSNRLDVLEQHKAGTEQKFINLIEKINNLVITMRWFMGLMIGSFVSFFFYMIQHGMFK